MLVCFGIAPISVSLCASAAAFAPLVTEGCGAELAVEGAAEAPEEVGGGGEDPSVTPPDSGVVISTGAEITVAGALWIAGADMGLSGLLGFSGLTGLVGLVGLLSDLTQVFDEVSQSPHTGCPYGLGHMLLRVCVMLPTNPVGHVRAWDWVLTWHVGGSGLHVSDTLNQPLSVAVPPMQLLSRFQVSVPEKLMGQGRCSVTAE
jgi:hypothetical protein